MTDNTTYTPGTGATVATDVISDVHYQRMKLCLGADGEAADLDGGQQAMAASVPVVVASDQRPPTAPASTAHVHAPAANTAAIVTLSAVTAKKHYLPRVAWSYNAVPTGGGLTVTDDGDTVFSVSITADGAGYLPLGIESGTSNTDMVVTLAAGGAAVTGKVNTPGARTV